MLHSSVKATALSVSLAAAMVAAVERFFFLQGHQPPPPCFLCSCDAMLGQARPATHLPTRSYLATFDATVGSLFFRCRMTPHGSGSISDMSAMPRSIPSGRPFPASLLPRPPLRLASVAFCQHSLVSRIVIHIVPPWHPVSAVTVHQIAYRVSSGISDGPGYPARHSAH